MELTSIYFTKTEASDRPLLIRYLSYKEKSAEIIQYRSSTNEFTASDLLIVSRDWPFFARKIRGE